MSYRCCVRGAQGGMLAGFVVMLFFFVTDLVRLDPFATPLAISGYVLGPMGVELDLPVISQAVALVTFGVRLLVVTVLHFLAFALLGTAFVTLRDRLGSPINLTTGVLYGLLAGTGVFYLSFAVLGRSAVVDSPGLPWVLVANALAGMVMAGYIAADSSDPAPVASAEPA